MTGRIEQGKIESGNEVEIVGIHEKIEKTVVTSMEMFNKTLDYAQAACNAGALLRGTKREEIDVARCSPSRLDHAAHGVQGRGLRPLEGRGGRHTPFFNDYRPQFYFRTTDVTGAISSGAMEMVMPGDNTNMDIELIQPIAMDQGLRFAVREGGRTVGAGVVHEIEVDHWAMGYGATENPHPSQGVRPPAARPVGPVDRRHRSTQRGRRSPVQCHADGAEHLLRDPQSVQGQGLARALRGADAQAADRHP